MRLSATRPKASLTARLFRRSKKKKRKRKSIQFVSAWLCMYLLQLLQQSLVKNNVLRGAVKNAYSSRELTEKQTITQFIGLRVAETKNQ